VATREGASEGQASKQGETLLRGGKRVATECLGGQSQTAYVLHMHNLQGPTRKWGALMRVRERTAPFSVHTHVQASPVSGCAHDARTARAPRRLVPACPCDLYASIATCRSQKLRVYARVRTHHDVFGLHARTDACTDSDVRAVRKLTHALHGRRRLA